MPRARSASEPAPTGQPEVVLEPPLKVTGAKYVTVHHPELGVDAEIPAGAQSAYEAVGWEVKADETPVVESSQESAQGVTDA